MSDTIPGRPAEQTSADRGDGELARALAVRQLERTRRFWGSTIMGTLGLLALTVIWAVTEYHNAGGWPTHGFSQSSGIHDVWNSWIIYPALAWVFLTAAHAWAVYGRKPISEQEIKREIERQAGHR